MMENIANRLIYFTYVIFCIIGLNGVFLGSIFAQQSRFQISIEPLSCELLITEAGNDALIELLPDECYEIIDDSDEVIREIIQLIDRDSTVQFFFRQVDPSRDSGPVYLEKLGVEKIAQLESEEASMINSERASQFMGLVVVVFVIVARFKMRIFDS